MKIEFGGKRYYSLLLPVLFNVDLNARFDITPNIVLINIDDWGWTDLSCNGNEFYETPNIDKLKSKGILFPVASPKQITGTIHSRSL